MNATKSPSLHDTQPISERTLEAARAEEVNAKAAAHAAVELLSPVLQRFERKLDALLLKMEDIENAQANQRQGLELMNQRCQARHGNGRPPSDLADVLGG